MNSTHNHCPVEELQVSSISDHEWRVADGRLSDQSPGKVLGFIQRKGASFEVLDLGAPDRDIFFDTWMASVQFFGEASSGVLNGAR
jgi:hypothetical protein